MTARVVIIMNDAAGGNTTAEVQQGSLRPIYLDGIFGVFQRGRSCEFDQDLGPGLDIVQAGRREQPVERLAHRGILAEAIHATSWQEIGAECDRHAGSMTELGQTGFQRDVLE